jgi:hypothetical protein
MTDSDEDLGKSRRPGAENREWSSTGRILGDRTIERSGDAVCGLYRAHRDKEHEFLGRASKSWSTVFWFMPQNRQLRFDDLRLKITATVSWFEPKNQASFGLSFTPQN